MFHSGLDASRGDAGKACAYNLLTIDQPSVGGNKGTNYSSSGIRKLFLMQWVPNQGLTYPLLSLQHP